MNPLHRRHNAAWTAIALIAMASSQAPASAVDEPPKPPDQPGNPGGPAHPGAPAGPGATGTPGAPASPVGKPVTPAGSKKPGTPRGTAPGPQIANGDQALGIAYRYLLEAVVTESGLVRYDRLAGALNLEMLKNVVRLLSEADLPEGRPERIAFLCNAYNANVLLNALNESHRSEFKNVLGVRGFFDEVIITVAGQAMTLNELEARLQALGDPRMRAALVCAAMSAPPLRREPYVAARLDEQFDDQCRRWINDPAKFHLETGGASLSMILDWHSDDFKVKPFGDRIGFVLKYAEPGSPIAEYLKGTKDPAILWELFDWALNNAPVLSPTPLPVVTPMLPPPATPPPPTTAPPPPPATPPTPAPPASTPPPAPASKPAQEPVKP